MRRLVTLLCAVLALNGLAIGAAHADPCGKNDLGAMCGVDSDGSGYHGVVIVPGMRSNDGGGSGGATTGCADCEWTVVPACWVNSPTNGADALCGAAIQSCGGPEILFWVYVRRPGQPWDKVGTACIGPTTPVISVDQVAADARRYVRDLRPTAASMSVQPRPVSLVNGVTYFAASGVDDLTGTFGPGGARVAITATPSYVWDWGDGSPAFETGSRGGPFPDGDVRHTYRRAGRPTVTLTTRWSATFSVVTVFGTYGPWDVPGPPVAPATTRVIDVREARADLVHGPRQ